MAQKSGYTLPFLCDNCLYYVYPNLKDKYLKIPSDFPRDIECLNCILTKKERLIDEYKYKMERLNEWAEINCKGKDRANQFPGHFDQEILDRVENDKLYFERAVYEKMHKAQELCDLATSCFEYYEEKKKLYPFWKKEVKELENEYFEKKKKYDEELKENLKMSNLQKGHPYSMYWLPDDYPNSFSPDDHENDEIVLPEMTYDFANRKIYDGPPPPYEVDMDEKYSSCLINRLYSWEIRTMEKLGYKNEEYN